jgi:hypothetical protein
MPVLELSKNFWESADLLIKLTDGSKDDDKGVTPEMREMEDRAEKLWYQLTEVETTIMDAMSADLWYFVEGGPLKGPEPTDELQVRFEQAKRDDDLLGIAWSLHNCPKLAAGVEGARIRLYLWKSIGQEEMANRFNALLGKLTSEALSLATAVSTDVLETDRRGL